MSMFSTRSVSVLNLPLPDGASVLKPEQIILRFESGRSVDIGALCYLRREVVSTGRNKIRKSAEGRAVDLTSFNQARANRVRALITHISNDVRHSGRRVETCRDLVSRFIAFMGWADENDYRSVLDSAEAARSVVRAYAWHIRERVKMNALSVNSGARQQWAVFSFLSDFFDVDELVRGINLLRVRHATVESTNPPNEEAQSKVLALCEALFAGLTDLVLARKSYPFQIVVPKYLNWPDDALWIFPTSVGFMPPQMLAKRQTHYRFGWGYNYGHGRLSTLDELRSIKQFAEDTKSQLKAIQAAKQQLATANNDPRHTKRIQAGARALDVFILMFLAQTGMNWAQIIDLPWGDDYEVSASHQAFRTIKWRAGNKDIHFELPIAFMPKFRRYIELRKYLLNGYACPFLFFKLGPQATGKATKIIFGPQSTYITLRRIDPDLPKVMPRQWRAAKSDWLIRNTDPSIAAMVLQNSEKTVLASYAAGSETTHMEEMTVFFDMVKSKVISSDEVIDTGVSRAIGICSDYGTPHQISGDVPVQPDCKREEGCLFCEKFRIHADERDVRKLLSCRYCLQQMAPLAGSEERFQATLNPIFTRIQVILDEVHSRDVAVVPKITYEVENEGELDPYWASKLEMLIDLGLIA